MVWFGFHTNRKVSSLPKKTTTTTTTTTVETTDAKTKTRIVFLLDRSGSMETIKVQTIKGFNAYIEGLKSQGLDMVFTLVQFDSMGLTTSPTLPIKQVPDLNSETFMPRASTPLIDAAYNTILAAASAAQPDENVVICIQTDGEENASVAYSMDRLNLLIKEKSQAGWAFNFMGVGIDAYKYGAAMGISPQNTMTYGAGMRETTNAFLSNASATGRFSQARAMGGAMGMAASTAYTGMEKLSVDDPTAKADALAGVGVKPLVDKPKID